MVKIICNRCGKDVNAKKIGYIAYNFRDGLNGDLLEANEFEDCHYCPKCMKSVKEFLKGEPGPLLPPEGQAETVPKEQETASGHENTEQPNRQRIDIGKIMALRNAGWNNEKIAEEMHMTKASVATSISTYKKKCQERGNL